MQYKFNKNSINAIVFFLKKRPALLTLVTIFGILYSIAETVGIGIVMPTLQQITQEGGNNSELGILSSQLYKLATCIPYTSPLISALIMLSITILLKSLFAYIREISSVFIGLSVREGVQKELFSQLLNVKFTYFLRKNKGDLQYRVITAPNQMGNLITIVPNILTEVIKCIAILILLASISLKITAFMVVFGGLFLIVIRYLASFISYYTGRGRTEASSDMTVYCNQALSGIKVLKTYKAEKFWENKFVNSVKKFYDFARKDTIYLHLPAKLLESIAIVSLCIFIGFLHLNSPDRLIQSIPMIGLYAVAIQRMIPSLNAIGREIMQFMSLLPYGEACFEAIKESGYKIRVIGSKPAIFNYSIKMENVSLKYKGIDRKIIDDLNFEVKKGEYVAIVGKSGAGKTSIVDMFLKMKSPSSGNIYLDSINLKDVIDSEWYDLIGYVGQEIFMFNGSIKENVLFGYKENDDQKVKWALKKANASEFVDKMAKGINEIVGDDGMTLSGGQRQRIAIARSLIRNPDILIFDEATSSLDNQSEYLIKKSINELSKDKTIIVIAHKLDSVMDADRVVVIDKGKIVEDGSPKKLIQEDSHFFKLYDVNEQKTKRI